MKKPLYTFHLFVALGVVIISLLKLNVIIIIELFVVLFENNYSVLYFFVFAVNLTTMGFNK